MTYVPKLTAMIGHQLPRSAVASPLTSLVSINLENLFIQPTLNTNMLIHPTLNTNLFIIRPTLKTNLFILHGHNTKDIQAGLSMPQAPSISHHLMDQDQHS